MLRKISKPLVILFVIVLVISLFLGVLVLDYSGTMTLRPFNIAKLYAGYQPNIAVPGPEFLPDDEYREIIRDEKYYNSTRSEDSRLTENEKLAVINKWAKELRPYFGSFMLASAMDELPFRIGQGILANSASTAKTASSIGLWAQNRLQHTQHTDFFRDFPGRDPWGSLNLFEPLYKKVLPSEMVAKSAYTGKITGKCCSLAALLTSIFAVTGANPEDIVIVRYDSHEVGLVKYDDGLYITNNNRIDRVDADIQYFLLKQKYKGFFSYSLSIMQDFKLDAAFFNTDTTLTRALANLTGSSSRLPAKMLFAADDLQDRAKLQAKVFGNPEDEQHLRLFTLARYAYQSLDVQEPELYLKASVRAPAVQALARKLRSIESIVSWIEDNIASAPLFDDYAERLMLADQVIVFKKGGPKDQAVLACALLWLNGRQSIIKITAQTAYLEVGAKIYDARTWTIANAPDGAVLLEMKLS